MIWWTKKSCKKITTQLKMMYGNLCLQWVIKDPILWFAWYGQCQKNINFHQILITRYFNDIKNPLNLSWFFNLLTLIFSLKSFQVIFLFWIIMYNFMKMDNLLTIMILTTVRRNGLTLTRCIMLRLANQLKSSTWTSPASIVSKITQIRFQIVSTNIFQKTWAVSYHGPQTQIRVFVMARSSFRNSKICLCPFLNRKSNKNWKRQDVLYQIVTKEYGMSSPPIIGITRWIPQE